MILPGFTISSSCFRIGGSAVKLASPPYQVGCAVQIGRVLDNVPAEDENCTNLPLKYATQIGMVCVYLAGSHALSVF